MAEAAEGPVLVFDSGIGGLTVLREARMLMPDRRFVYVADNAAFPYGDWPEEALLAHLLALFERLLEDIRPACVIIACNTAFTLAGSALRARFPATDFVGTVPAIKPAAERTASGLISVLATPATVKRDYTRALIESFAAHCHARLVGSKYLAALAESYISGGVVSDEALWAEIAPCFVEEDGRRTDIVVLACTHYPFLANRFRKLAPWPVDWLNPAEAIALQARRVLGERPSAAIEGVNRDVAIFTGSDVRAEIKRLMQGFGLIVADAAEV
ncbi:glutamate racemase [Martelella lutilitoris]|uniref:Glutamate racemase n=1 Tax=Martelella lutilitoris TaxID=2583532 RepID=A0A7T7HGW5_9HYPH|nr:glutamate racemase [Martelella lutilitoris]QQM28930.1 glutamate racemase [Martelella lutilitoris]